MVGIVGPVAGFRRWQATAAVSVAILGAGGAGSYLVYQTEKDALVAVASHDLRRASEAFVRALNHVFQPALTLSTSVVDSGLRRRDGEDLAEHFFALVNGPVRMFEQVNGAFLGFPDGRFLHLQDLTLAGEAVSDPTHEAVRRRTIDRPDSDGVGRWEQYDPESGGWTPVAGDGQGYVPLSRPWYRGAAEGGSAIWTEAYVFSSSGQLGVTYARPIYDQAGALWAVLGVDLSIGSLSRTLVTTSGELAELGEVVFATDLGNKVIGHPDFVTRAAELDRDTETFLARYRRPDSFESIVVRSIPEPRTITSVDAEGRTFLATKVQLDPTAAMPLQLFLARDLEAVLASAVSGVQRNVVLVFLAIVVFGTVASYAVRLRVEATARRKAEAELIDARDAAEAATRAKSSFLATMSHEIRTPMNGVMSMAELLSLTRLDAEQKRMARIIGDSATALLTIINDILDFSKIEAGKLEIERVGFSLAEVVGGSAELLAARAEDKGLDLLVDLDPSLIDARLGDPTRIRQVLLNLGSNAVKFTERGAIGIRVTALDESGRWLRFEVTDTGIGLSPEACGKLFQAFVQADTSTSRKYGGTGLGLSICRTLCELMGGRIGVDSTPGVGSTFWVELPLDPDAAEPPSYPGDLSGASVCLVGLSDAVAALAARSLRATGVDRIARAPDLATAGDADLLVVDGRCAGLDDGGLARRRGAVALVGRRSELGALPAGVKAAASVQLTLPLSSRMLWRAVAIAGGLEAADAVVADQREGLSFAPPEVEAARAADALILVAEDNETNQAVIRQLLSRMGMACEMAENGRVALSMLQTPGSGYGLLLTDFNMPEMDGCDLARAVRRLEEGTDRRLPIVALTADAMTGAEQASREAGMDAYLTKPIDSRKLGATLLERLPQAMALRRPAAVQPAPEAAGGPPDWDADIFDPATLGDGSGRLDEEAKRLVSAACDSWGPRIGEINAAFADGDARRARDVTHALKGATLSVGALRLGRIASDVQDFLDADDLDTARLMAEVLEPTLMEFRETLPVILRYAGR